MHGSQLDLLARALGARLPRRSAAGVLVALGLGTKQVNAGKKKKCRPKCKGTKICKDGKCRAPARCKTLRQSCTLSGGSSIGNCCGGTTFATLTGCEDNGCEGQVCCRISSMACTDDCDCCGDMRCFSGECGSTGGGGIGDFCPNRTDCYITPDESFSCETVCESYNTCCWNETWGHCEEHCDCCGSLLCLLQSDGHKYCMYSGGSRTEVADKIASTESTGRKEQGAPNLTVSHRSPERE